MSDHKAAKNAAAIASLATCFLAVGTPEDPNVFRPATAEDWKRCARHPIHPVPRAPGQTTRPISPATGLTAPVSSSSGRSRCC